MSHFRDFNSHRNCILNIYKTLLRHVTHIEQIEGISSEYKENLQNIIKNQFKLQKSQMSPWITKNRIEDSYKLEEELRNLYKDFSMAKMDKLDELINQLQIQKKTKAKVLRTVTHQPIKRDMSNVQDLETQRTTNYINRYIRSQQSKGLLPQTIDPLMRETLIKDEALHERAQLDIRRAMNRNSHGPYRVHVTTSSSGVSFVRSHLPQPKIIGKVITNYVKVQQMYFDLSNYYKENEYLYNMENEWETQLELDNNGYKGITDWGTDVKDLKVQYDNRIKQIKEKLKHYEENDIPRQLKELQLKSNEMHEKSQERLSQMLKEVENVTPYESLLGGETLREIVKKYKFQS